ncbi:MAG: flavodoxin family protein [Ethanoligenens sp.]
MRVILINGSPRVSGNTSLALDTMAGELKKEEIETEIVHVGGQLIHGCIACGYCETSKDHHCVFKDDPVNETAEKMRQADGFILGAPTYYAGIAGTMKSFLDRVFYTSSSYFSYKVASAVAVVRRTGGLDTLHQLQNYLALGETVTPSSQYWMVGYGTDKGELAKDGEGMQTIRKHARAFAWLLKVIDSGKQSIPLPPEEDRVITNFIR